ncbi:DUF1559 domain-containing protein [Fimbriiglobus ruber]|uniref:DUF1559 family PulG-like putative transporter n=1 Tax=Fimbriiglobus ruber TaxID=1908690 RepID=UPI00117A93A6|nr:DUF1559 domain-containing protein [Fimbriiglobus ruber]
MVKFNQTALSEFYMRREKNDRHAFTLIEVIIVLAIIGVLIGLLIPAVQGVRMAAARTAVQNQMRQIALGVANYENNKGKLPSQVIPQEGSMMSVLLPYSGTPQPVGSGAISPYTNRLDPSYAFYPTRDGSSSFAFNAQVFAKARQMSSITDGTSNTVMLTERYARCGRVTNVLWAMMQVLCLDGRTGQPTPCVNYPDRTATFADGMYNDILPQFNSAVGYSLGTDPALTFQSVPLPDACDPRIVQSSAHAGLMVVAMDGSVRIYTPSIQPAVYWSSITPDKGETITSD